MWVPVAGLLQVEFGAPRDDVSTVADELPQQLIQRQRARPSVDERDEVAAVLHLQCSRLVQLGEDGLIVTVPGQLDHQPHAVAVGLVAQVADALDLLVAHLRGDLFDDPDLVRLIGNLGKDDLHAIAAGRLFEVLLSAHGKSAAAEAIQPLEVFLVLAREDACGRRKIGTLDVLQYVVQSGLLVRQDRLDGAGQLGQVVRRNVTGHRHCDSGCAVEQQIRGAAGQHGRFVQGLVEVWSKGNRVPVQVGEHFLSDTRQPSFRITHRSGWIVIYRSKVALTVNQWMTQGKVLRHTYHRVIYGLVGVWMILTKNFANNTSGLTMRLIGPHAEIVHCIENASLDRLQPVAYIR